ncbi:MAG: T9SS type A sorting domain-containing protein, partial [Saprospiraceae bacterium]
RAYHYDVFGGTPVFVINGEPRTGSDVQNVSVYNPFFGSMSPFKVETSLESHHPDSITIISRIEAVETHTFTDISIYLPLVEDTVFYNAPNGENIHRDVFRQSFTGTEPLVIKAPIKSADPTSIKRTLQVRSIWDTSRLYAMSIVQSVSGDKPVLQSSKSPLLSKGSISSSDDESVKTLGLVVFPIITVGLLNFSRELSDISVIDRMGREVLKSKGVSIMHLDVSMLHQGMYFLLESDKDRPNIYKFIKI